MLFCCAVIVFIAITISGHSIDVFQFLNVKTNGSLHHFGIKTTRTDNRINTNLYLTVSFPGSKYECKLNPVDVNANEWPDVWYWCYIDDVYMSYCSDPDNNDYSITLTNDNNIPILVDIFLISIQNATTEIAMIQVDTFHRNNINEKYESLFPQQYAIESTQHSESVYDKISVEQTSILIKLNDVINDEAYNITIMEENTDKCAEDNGIFFIFVINKAKGWADAERYCENMYGTHLLTIDNEEKMNVVLEMGKKYNIWNAWIGLKYTNGQWGWVDGTSCGYVEDGICAHDQHWARGEPNGLPGESCAYTGENDDGYFNDIECWHQWAFYCHYNINSTNNVTTVGKNDNNSMNDVIRVAILGGVIFGLLAVLCIIAVFYLLNQENKTDEESPQIANDKIVSNSLIVDFSSADSELMDKFSTLAEAHGCSYRLKENKNHNQTSTEMDSSTDINSTSTPQHSHRDSESHDM